MQAKDWLLSIDSVLYDHNAFTADSLTPGNNNQFDAAAQYPPTDSQRRLLAFPEVARKGAALVAKKKDAGRKMLSLMMPVSNEISTTAVLQD